MSLKLIAANDNIVTKKESLTQIDFKALMKPIDGTYNGCLVLYYDENGDATMEEFGAKMADPQAYWLLSLIKQHYIQLDMENE